MTIDEERLLLIEAKLIRLEEAINLIRNSINNVHSRLDDGLEEVADILRRLDRRLNP